MCDRRTDSDRQQQRWWNSMTGISDELHPQHDLSNFHSCSYDAHTDSLTKSKCAVLYLDRFANGRSFSTMFLKSMSKFYAGCDFDYFHVLKGYDNSERDSYINSLPVGGIRNIRFVDVADDKLPLAAFLEIAKKIDHEKIITFLSWSRILSDNWLKSYIDAFDSHPDIGIVGATGGYERRDYRDLSLPFPNAGIRTNAFMIDRRLYIELAANVLTRAEELDFESGPDSLTRQIIRRGLRPVIVDRLGRIWDVPEWPRSRTFRSGSQQGLLIADNRTHDYERATSERRRKLSTITWGDEGWAEPNCFLKRAWVDVRWRYHRRRLRKARTR